MKKFLFLFIFFLYFFRVSAAVGDTILVDHYILKITSDVENASTVEALGHDHANHYSLEVLNIPPRVTYNNVEYTLTSIADSAFASCESHSFIIPPTVTACGDGAFPISPAHEKDKDAYPSSIPNPFRLSTGWGAIQENTYAVAYPVDECHIDYTNDCIYSNNGETLYYVPANRSGEFIVPAGVKEIGSRAFIYCDKITSVVLPDGITTIGYMSFYYCKGLTAINLPESITTISGRAFCNTALTSVDLPDALTKVEYEMFQGCASLTRVKLPEKLKTIRYSAFIHCTSLTEIEIPETVTSIEENAFRNTGLVHVEFPYSLRGTGRWYLYGCSNLESFSIPNNLGTIRATALSYCPKLDGVVIPNSVKTIEDWAFISCTGLETVTIGYGITQLAPAAFGKCSALKDMYITAEEPAKLDSTAIDTYAPEFTLHVLPESVEKYKADTLWGKFNITALTPLTKVEIDPVSIPQDLYPGQTFTPSLKFTPENADATDIFWTSTNPDVVSVNHYTGEVTVHQPELFNALTADAGTGAKIVATSLYRGVTDEYPKRQEITAIGSINTDSTDALTFPARVYNIQGICIRESASQTDVEALPRDIYIINGKKVFLK